MNQRSKKEILIDICAKDTSRTNFLLSVFINFIILLVFMYLTNLKYGTNDDFALSQAVVQRGYFFFTYTNYFLNAFVAFVQEITPFWNAWVGCQLAFSFLSFVVITFIFLEKTKESAYIRILGICIVLIFAYNHYTVFQFTQTASLLMVTGLVAMVQGAIHSSGQKMLILGGALFCIGTWYRNSGVYVPLGFAAIFALFFIIVHRKQFSFDLFKNRSVQIKIAILISVFLVMGISDNLSTKISMSTDDLRVYSEYNSARARFMDYPKPDYAENVEFFQALGISENDYNLMRSWILDSDTVASLENLKQINQVQQSLNRNLPDIPSSIHRFFSDTKHSILNLDMRGIDTIFLLIIAAMIMILTRFRYWSFFILFAVTYVLSYLYLYYIGRTPFRATYIIDLSAVIWCAYSIRSIHNRPYFNKERNKNSKTLIPKLAAIAILSASIFVIAISGHLKPTPVANDVDIANSDQLMSYISSHPDITFMSSSGVNATYRLGQYYYINPLAPIPKGFQDNIFSFGGWTMMSPYQKERLATRNLTNLFGDIVDNEHIYVIETDDMQRQREELFFNEHYALIDKTIYFESVEQVGIFSLWKIKATIE